MTGTETMLATAVTALAGTIAYLFKLFYESRKEILTELRDCQQDREKLWADRAEIYRVQAENNVKLVEQLPVLVANILKQKDANNP
jgi:hypothetical protein